MIIFNAVRLYYGEMDFAYGFFVLLLAPKFYLPLRTPWGHTTMHAWRGLPSHRKGRPR
jgi:ABC-type transport system involved in cytochrome bd biosynthesis fused ATPase/permease subunit